MSKLPDPSDDGLLIPEVGIWGESKYRLIRLYCDLFTKSMRGKWGNLVYVDLFCGPGIVRLRETGRLTYGSPLISLDLEEPFDRYIFCEATESKLDSLCKRVNQLSPDTDVRYVSGDANNNTESILSEMPTPRRTSTVLGLCLADPFKLSNLHFETIRMLSTRFLDFLMLIPTHMDANRNLGRYLDPKSKQIEQFTGVSNWRDQWKEARRSRVSFDLFFTDCYGSSMQTLQYIYEGANATELIRSVPKNLPLYRLALFSRHKLGRKFWKEARKYSQAQLDLFGQ